MTSLVHGGMQLASMQRALWLQDKLARFARGFLACTPTYAGWVVAAGAVLLITSGSVHAQNGPLAYVANLGNGTTTVIDTVTKQILTTVPAGGSFDIAAT